MAVNPLQYERAESTPDRLAVQSCMAGGLSAATGSRQPFVIVMIGVQPQRHPLGRDG